MIGGEHAGLGLLAPELALTGGLVAALGCDLVPGGAWRRRAPWIGIAACVLAGVLLPAAGHGAVGPMLAADAFAGSARGLILAVAASVLLANAGERRDDADRVPSTAAVLALALGAAVVALSCHCVPLWLGLELVALSSYALVAIGGGDRRAAEAGMKFVLFGGVASAAMLFGMSHVYGATGSLDFAGIGAGFAAAGIVAVPAVVLAALGLAYKLTLVPVHFYAPDVYQGSSSLAVAAVSTLPKIGAAAALVRALRQVLPATVVDPGALTVGFAVFAAASMLFAAVTAVVQRDAKRILAFSGVGHGVAIVLAAACQPAGDAAAAVAYYLLTYVTANLGAFVCLSVLERSTRSCSLDEIAGAVKSRPWVASLLCLFLLSLAGVPPLAGFLGKWGVLRLVLAAGASSVTVISALVFLVATVIAAWSYLLIVRAVVFAPAVEGMVAERARGPVRMPTVVVLVVAAVATLGLGLWLDGFGVMGGQ